VKSHYGSLAGKGERSAPPRSNGSDGDRDDGGGRGSVARDCSILHSIHPSVVVVAKRVSCLRVRVHAQISAVAPRRCDAIEKERDTCVYMYTHAKYTHIYVYIRRETFPGI